MSKTGIANSLASQAVKPLSQAAKDSLEEYLSITRDKVTEIAQEISQKNAGKEITSIEIVAAAETLRTNQEPNFGHRVLDSISAMTLLAALMTLIFGCLGLFDHFTNGDSSQKQGWLDIAKIFAGTVVGSAGASVVSSRRR